MKKWWREYRFVFISVFLWRTALFFVETLSSRIVPMRDGYFGPIPWANFDGVHYLRISESGYFQYGEAFFPLYPLCIRLFHTALSVSPSVIGAGISFISFTIGLCILFSLVKRQSLDAAMWTVILFLAFPTSFFFTSVYSEGLFFLLSMLTIYFADKKKWVLCVLAGALASATRLYGVLLLIPVFGSMFSEWEKKKNTKIFMLLPVVCVGLLSYMWFLYGRTGDLLYFFHVQPAFGANRSGDTLILLPQVFWRYGKILFTAFGKPTPISYIISIFELICALGSLFLLWLGWKKKINTWLLLFSGLVLLIPTLTGTLSSVPRYMLSAFPLFITMGMIDNKRTKIALAICFSIVLIGCTGLFLRGWFIA